MISISINVIKKLIVLQVTSLSYWPQMISYNCCR